MKFTCKRHARHLILLVAALPILQLGGCLPQSLAQVPGNAVSSYFWGHWITSLETVLYNVVDP